MPNLKNADNEVSSSSEVFESKPEEKTVKKVGLLEQFIQTTQQEVVSTSHTEDMTLDLMEDVAEPVKENVLGGRTDELKEKKQCVDIGDKVEKSIDNADEDIMDVGEKLQKANDMIEKEMNSEKDERNEVTNEEKDEAIKDVNAELQLPNSAITLKSPGLSAQIGKKVTNLDKTVKILLNEEKNI